MRSALKRGLALTVVLMLLGALAGGTFGWYRQRYTEARATILVNPLDGNPFSASGSGDNLTNMGTEAQLVSSHAVATSVVESTGTARTIDDLLGWVEVVVPTNTQLIEITFRSLSADEAVVMAQAFAAEFLAFREARARAQVEAQIEVIDSQIADRRKERTDLEKRLRNATQASTAAALQSQIDSTTAQINTLRSRIAELRIGPFSPGQVVTPAAVREEGLLASWGAFAVLGGLAGLVLALMVALVRARLDNRIHHVDDIAVAGRLVLGQVTQAEAWRAHAELLAVTAVTDPDVAQPFRDLRVSVLTSDHRRPLAVLVASGGSEGEAIPLFAPGLALATATAGLRTVVLDTVGGWAEGAFRRSGRTLEEMLASHEAPVSALEDRNPLIISATGDNTEDRFMSPAMARVMRSLRQHADLVLVVTGGVKHSRSRALADCVDAVITEVVEGTSRQHEVRLDNPALQAKDLGVVYVTGAPPRAVAVKAAAHQEEPRPAAVTVEPAQPDRPAEEPPESPEPAAAGQAEEPAPEPRPVKRTTAKPAARRRTNGAKPPVGDQLELGLDDEVGAASRA